MSRWLLGFFCVIGLAVSALVGGSWSDRLGDHRGLHLVAVPDKAPDRGALVRALPRRTVIVVFDGLGIEEAAAMPALAAVGRRGQCLRTYVGSLSVSQPVYAVLSTGLEQDRSGARNNEPPASVLRAENLWAIARQAGLTVSAISEQDWWQRLFPATAERPAAFSTYLVRPRAENFFANAAPADVMLIHPLYVDEAGHEHGAASAAYRAAVARADQELAGFLGSFDFARDLLLVTADHGHSLRGGHGGQQPRIANVLTCVAGPGVRRDAEVGRMDATSVAPTLAVLLGLRFPAHMRAGVDAGDDDLDAVWRIVDPGALPAAYLNDRKEAVARFRDQNRAALRALPGAPPSWRWFYAQERAAQDRRVVSVGIAGLLILGLFARFPARPPWPGIGAAPTRDAALCVAFVVLVYLALYVLIGALRGGCDPTSINTRTPFMLFSVQLSAAVLLGAGVLHLSVRRSLAALRADVLALVAVTIALSLGHPAALGWLLGFPMPAPWLIFFPYFAALFLLTLSLLALPLCGGFTWLRRAPAAHQKS